MKLVELQEKNDEDLFDFALDFGAVEEGTTPRRMEIFRKVFKACSDKEETIIISIKKGWLYHPFFKK